MVIRLPVVAFGFPLPLLEGSIAPAPAIGAAVCVLVAAVGAHAGAALLVYSPTKLGRLRKSRPALLENLQRHDNEYQVLARILALGGLTGALLLASHATAGSLGMALTAPLGIAALLLCGVLPAALAEFRAEAVVDRTLPLLRILHGVLRYPVLLPLVAVTRWLMRALGVRTSAPSEGEELAEEIVAAVSDSVSEGQLEDEEREWISNIVELKDLRVSEVMTPRTDVKAFAAETSLRDAVQGAVAHGHSRYPAFDESVDKIVGIFYAKDALARLVSDDEGDTNTEIRSLLRKPLFVPESMEAIQLLEQFKATRTQLAVVLDEYGGTAGIVTIEDILEEIVGDISDEYDLDEQETIKVLEEGKLIEITGRARIDEVNAALAVSIPEDPEYDTLAGLVFNKLGRIPEVGDSYETDGVQIRILAADGRRIERLRVTILQTQGSEG